MHKLKSIFLSVISILMLILINPLPVSANSTFTPSELIEIVNPYILETVRSYELKNESELISKIGSENVASLKIYLIEASKEKAALLRRDAVLDIHITVLRLAGATVDRYWWGTKIKTETRQVAINVRNLANGFSGAAGTLGMTAALIAAGISFIPGLGTAATIAGVVIGITSWADSTTWSNVSMLVANKIDLYQYKLTIDINKWVMDVQVYRHD